MITMHRETYQQAHLEQHQHRKRKKTKDKNVASGEDYKEVMYAFYMSLEKPAGSHTENTFRI